MIREIKLKGFWEKFFILSLVTPFCGFVIYLIWLGGKGFNLNDLKDFIIIILILWITPMLMIYTILRFEEVKNEPEEGQGR